MVNQEHLDILKQGVDEWNRWRKEYYDLIPDLSQADLSGANLARVDLSRTNLNNANLNNANLVEATLELTELVNAQLSEANLCEASLCDANLSGANLREAYIDGAGLDGTNLEGADLSETEMNWVHVLKANLSKANLRNAILRDAIIWKSDLSSVNLSGADLSNANLNETNLSEANLNGANLSNANLSGTNLSRADLTGCLIYAISAWDVILTGATQSNLIITNVSQSDEPVITVDNLEVAQFIYLLINNNKIREVIDTITSKVVLILGRFTPERKRVLDALRDELLKKDYLPVVFDFKKPTNRDLTETVSTLAHMARFIIADITDPKSIPQELKTIIPNLPSVVVQPLLHARSKEYGMFEHFQSFPWVLEAYRYTTVDRLLASLKEHIIEPAEQKAQVLTKR